LGISNVLPQNALTHDHMFRGLDFGEVMNSKLDVIWLVFVSFICKACKYMIFRMQEVHVTYNCIGL